MLQNRIVPTRRQFLKLTVAGLSAVPLGAALHVKPVAAAEMVSEDDPTAKALKYSADASKSSARTDPGATCASCKLYTGVEGAADGPCAIFQGKHVSANGWCSGWSAKG